MPSKSNKAVLIELIILLGLAQELLPQFAILSENEVLLALAALENSRYTVAKTIHVPKSTDWIEEVLSNDSYSDQRFRNQLRMDRSAFNYLLGLLKDNSAYGIGGEPVALQLAVALYRFGHFGNSASFLNVATKFGISEGAVELYTTRTIEAILIISNQWICWNNQEEKDELNVEMSARYFPKCLGFVDGSAADLFSAPLDDKETYWSRKKRYSIQFQVVCDRNRKILHFTNGYPGSVHDSKVYATCELSKNPTKYFLDGEYLIGDSAYTKTDKMIPPYRKPNNGFLTSKQKQFNKHLSSERVAVEHTIGMLKGRFPSLTGLRVIVDKAKGHEKACKWIYCTAVLHNILLSIDPWSRDDDEILYDLDEIEEINQGVLDNCNLNSADGKREYLLNLICS